MPLRKNILIVDDSKINRQILRKILSTDYNIIEAENGAVALTILREKHESISVVLLDIVMPVLDGYEVLRQIHKDAFLSKIPVIVASGQDSEDAEVKALSLGALDYVLKPYKPEIIRHRISNTIFLRETSAFVNSVQHDALTGVYGKEYFYLQATSILKSNPQKKFDLICFDVERFKLVNDMYGMQVGDELLRFIGRTLINTLTNQMIGGRIGADEFACLIPHREDYSNEMLLKSITKLTAFSDTIKLNLILRYGIYVIDDPTTPINIICDRACLAKDSIKGKYNTYFAFYDDTIRHKLLNEQMIVSEMKTALSEHQFKVYFQPKYNLKTEKIVGAEALVRWIHPQKGFMAPNEFIPLFKKNGFITNLDLYVWDQCCRKIRAWMDQGHIATPVSVNVSRADIYNIELPQILLSMIRKYDLSPQYLHLEITETAYTEDPEQLISVVQKLKKLGFIIEMDDFGTGYSSLNMLSELPIDILKLDVRFIQKEEKKSKDRSVLSFIISLAKWMDLKVVAEGVETENQVQMLRALSCEYAQGYYYAKPMPQAEFEQHLLKSEIQSLYPTVSNQIHAKKDSEDKRPAILLWDDESADFENLQKDLKSLYHIQQVFTREEADALLHDQDAEVAAVIISLCPAVTSHYMTTVIQMCEKENLPIMVIYDTSADAKNDILTMPLSDYIARPYDTVNLISRIRNAIAYKKMERYEQQKEINAAIIEMRKRAERDALTGLFNRAEFEFRIDNFFYHNDNPDGIYIILDIDNFKSVNDNYGHLTGDKVLHEIGSRLMLLFPETEIIGRIGGDEFALFIPYMLSPARLQEKMLRLCMPMELASEGISITCSAGVCFSPDYGITHNNLYRNADMALLSAKRNGKSQFEIFDSTTRIVSPYIIQEKTIRMLDNVSEAMFVSDAITSQIIYINETACGIIKKDRKNCLNKRCFELFWDSCQRCDRCVHIDTHSDDFYEETTYLKDRCTVVHIKARVEEWDGRKVKVHYLRVD